MSVNKWAYDPEVCDDHYCCGDCDRCYRANDTELYDNELDFLDEESEHEIEREIKALRKGEE